MRILALLSFALAGVVATGQTFADWQLDPARSHLSFVTIKSKDVAEVSSFDTLSGAIDADGRTLVSVMLDSVDTNIPVRDERMRKFLFQTANYKEASLQAKLDPAVLDGMKVGEIRPITAEATLTVHGESQSLTLVVQVVKVDAHTLMAATRMPLIVDAGKFGMADGVEKLREIAGLPSISDAVPVTFVVTFVSADGKQ